MLFSPCIMCVQYHGGGGGGGGAYHDACGGYLEYHGDVQYCGDIMIHVGADLEYHGGYLGYPGGYLEYHKGDSVLWGKS